MTMTNAAKIQTAMSDLYGAMSDVSTTGVKSDPVLQPSCRAALRICIDRLYAALETPLDDGAQPGPQLRFRTMAGASASHAETLLAWSFDQKG
jgi:hypothetical protein